VARPCSALRERVWDIATEQRVTQECNPVMTSAMAIAKVRLARFLHSWFQFLRVPAHDSRHFLLSALLTLQVHFLLKLKFWIFPLITYFRYRDWILCCDWYALHGAGRQVALWPYPRPFPSVRNRVWPRETKARGSHIRVARRSICDRDQESWSVKIVLDHLIAPFWGSWSLDFTGQDVATPL